MDKISEKKMLGEETSEKEVVPWEEMEENSEITANLRRIEVGQGIDNFRKF